LQQHTIGTRADASARSASTIAPWQTSLGREAQSTRREPLRCGSSRSRAAPVGKVWKGCQILHVIEAGDIAQKWRTGHDVVPRPGYWDAAPVAHRAAPSSRGPAPGWERFCRFTGSRSAQGSMPMIPTFCWNSLW
jgi:hypothetical protein